MPIAMYYGRYYILLLCIPNDISHIIIIILYIYTSNAPLESTTATSCIYNITAVKIDVWYVRYAVCRSCAFGTPYNQDTGSDSVLQVCAYIILCDLVVVSAGMFTKIIYLLTPTQPSFGVSIFGVSPDGLRRGKI